MSVRSARRWLTAAAAMRQTAQLAARRRLPLLALVAVQLAVVSAVPLAVRRRRLSPQVLAALADMLLRRFSAAHSQRMVHEWAAAAVRRRALFSKRGARELVDVARAAVAEDVEIAQPFDAYYDGVVKKEIRALEYSVAACDHRWKEAQREEMWESDVLRGLRQRAKVLNGGCKVATRIVAVTEERRDRRPPPLLPRR